MSYPIQIVYRGVEPSEALDAEIRRRAGRLGHFRPDVVGCKVTIEQPHKHHQHGNHYRVHLEVSLPGDSLTVICGDAQERAHEDPYLVVRDVCEVATRRLEEQARRARALSRKNPLRAANE